MADARSQAGLGEEGVHVNVILRCRPANPQEMAERSSQAIQCNEALREVTLYQSVGGKSLSRTFRYDKVFGPDSYQEKVYNQAIVPIVQEVLEGFNCTIFAYGQTGTGKTYTMEGGPRNSTDGKRLSAEAGVIPRAIKQVFDAIESDDVTDSSVKVSFLELYNEELTDLLSVADDKDKRLRLLEDRSGVVVQGLEEMVVKNAAEIYQVLDRGTSKRRTAETLLNKRSSRSHSIFTVTIHMKETTPEGEDVIKIGKLNLVDLAGSENISRSGAKDGRAREAGNINQSLLTLGRVITALVEHSGHIPYRDSKLTRLLRDSLGGKTKTCIIATIGPSVTCVEETVSTLDYAHRAKNIRNRPEVNQRISKTTMIKELTTEIERLKLDLVATREKNGIFISSERYDQYELDRAQLRDMMGRSKAEVEAMATAHAEELEALSTRAAEAEARLGAKLRDAEARLADTEARLAAAEVAIQERQFIAVSHRRSEQAIAAHAQDVSRSLGEAAGELAEVFSRLRASLAVTGADRAALEGMAADGAARAEKLRAALDKAVAAQREQLRGVAGAAAEFRARKQAELEAMRGQLRGMEARVADTRAAVEGALAAAADGAGAALASLSGPQAAALARAADAAEAAGKGAAAALEALAESLEAQAGAVGALASAAAADAQKGADAARAAMARAGEGLAEARSAVTGVRDAAGAAASAAADALKSFASDFDAAARERESALLTQISSLLGAFVSERREAVAGAVEGVRRRLQEGDAALGATAGGAAKAAKDAAGALQADAKAYEKEVAKQLKALAAGAKGIGAALGAAGRDAGAVREGVSRYASEAAAEAGRQRAALEAAEGKGRAAVDAGGAAAGAAAARGAEELAAGAGGLLAAVEAAGAADAAVADGLEAAAGGADKAIKAFAKQHADGLAAAAAALRDAASAALAAAPPALPSERAFAVPSEERVGELLCPPKEVLLEYFRSEREEILRRGGDVNEAFQLLSPERKPPSPAASDGGAADGENAPPQEAEEASAPSPAPGAAGAKAAAAPLSPAPSAAGAKAAAAPLSPAPSAAGARAAAKAAAAAAAEAKAAPEPSKPATRGVGRRTRIPAYNGDGSRSGLSDMTNRE
ncbi:hypothetical protein Rsub_10381 [Raphidocelis subcapitata]|uniref:Kinesin motor domain-containing protein n=1 Tax=Raphidocelis subcapitata TaxID=307507 RepID=A0A2V0PC79_9CHLO|nr:hypothetical protein Rsub_10381 [Raphidocelis subcapitata]|eukprot:GBF97458.1 hypothetical protein Rsub_10381 [Raphidocelis subcapitata]